MIGTKPVQIHTNPQLDLVILKLFSILKDFGMLSTGTHTCPLIKGKQVTVPEQFQLVEVTLLEHG